MIFIYATMTVFTFALFFFTLFIMNRINATEIGSGSGDIQFYIYFFIGFLVIYVGATFSVGRAITKQVAFPAKVLAKAAARVAIGDVDVELTHQSKDEMGVLTEEFRKMLEAIKLQSQVLETVSEGNYTVSIPVRSEHDVMNRAISSLLDNNNTMLMEIHTATNQVSGGATQIADGAQALATGSTQQAATVEELSATTAQVLTQTQENSHNARKTLDLMNQAGNEMQETVKYMEELKERMLGVSTSSEKISKVIKVIDDIAFQTNILALNAAVEAARAGQHGKGFAVVADEVRNLASKSAEAAKETAAMIQVSVNDVQKGNEMVDKTSQSVEQVANTAQQAQERIHEINEASQLQEKAISQINEGIEQISQVVQHNSATSEENAAAGEELSEQSQALKQLVGRFRIKDLESHSALPSSHSSHNRLLNESHESSFAISDDIGKYGKY